MPLPGCRRFPARRVSVRGFSQGNIKADQPRAFNSSSSALAAGRGARSPSISRAAIAARHQLVVNTRTSALRAGNRESSCARTPRPPTLSLRVGAPPLRLLGLNGCAPTRPSAGWLARTVVDERAELHDPEPLYLRRPDAVAPGPRKPAS